MASLVIRYTIRHTFPDTDPGVPLEEVERDARAALSQQPPPPGGTATVESVVASLEE